MVAPEKLPQTSGLTDSVPLFKFASESVRNP